MRITTPKLGPPSLLPRLTEKRRRTLPAWPLAMGVAGYPLWWLLGVGDLVWPPLAVVMVFYLAARGPANVRVPRGFGVWLLFLLWMTISVVQIGTFGRLIGFAFRALLYLSATVIFVYVYNARTSITKETIGRLASQFLAVMTVGGFLGIALPLLSFRTPLAYLLPASLRANEYVHEMVVRRVTQFNPDAWAPGSPRPSAPFVYTNGWGYAYAVILPIAIAYAISSRGHRRLRWLVPTIVLSTVPAFLTLNRGMFIGLGVALLYIVVRAVLARNVKVLAVVMAVSVIGALVFALLPTEERLSQRLDTSSSTEDRFGLYIETIERTAESPIIGFGAPRPSETAGAPAVGTQGQIWSVIFSHGFGAAIPFILWFLLVCRRSRYLHDPIGLAMGGAVLSTSVTIFFYGLLNAGLMLIFMVCGVIMRAEPDQIDRAATPASPRITGLD